MESDTDNVQQVVRQVSQFDGMSKIYADNLAHLNSDSSRGIAGRGVAMQAIKRDLNDAKYHYCNKFGHYTNDCAEFKAVRQQNQRRRQRQHKQRGGHQSK